MCLFPLALPLVHSLEITVNSLGSAQIYMCFANRPVLSVVPAAPRLQGRAASVSQAGPSPGAALVGAWEQEVHLCPPSLAREHLPRGDTEGTGASYTTEGAFSCFRRKTLLRGCTLLSSTSFYCFFKQNTLFCL